MKNKVEKTKVTWYILADSYRKLRELMRLSYRSAGMEVSHLINEAHKAKFPEEYADTIDGFDSFVPEGMTEEEFAVEQSL